jgi:hypothetical protein
MTLMLRGPSLLRQHITTFLQTVMPLAVATMRDHYGLDQYQLPAPGKYDAIDPTSVDNDDYPAVGCVVLNGRNYVREDWDLHAQQVYSVVYTVRFVIVARTAFDAEGEWEESGKASAIRVRDDLTACLQNILLSEPAMGRPDAIKMNEVALTTDYLEPFMANTQGPGRWVAASLVNTEIAFTESTYLPPYGTAETITVDERILTP